MIFKNTSFKKAIPIWEKGMQTEQNHAVLFETIVDGRAEALLRISGYTGYQIFVNEQFVHWGPARAGRGYYRVDEIPLCAYLKDGRNAITVLATGYYCHSFEWFKEPSFLCAEIEKDGEIICYTGGNGWNNYNKGWYCILYEDGRISGENRCCYAFYGENSSKENEYVYYLQRIQEKK